MNTTTEVKKENTGYSSHTKYEKGLALSLAIYVPLIKAMISGTLTGSLIFSVFLFIPFFAQHLIKIALLSVISCIAAYWFYFAQNELYLLEAVLGIDINQDGFIGEPGAEAGLEPGPGTELEQPTHIEVISNGGQQSSFLNLPVPYAKLRKVAAICKASNSYTIRSLTGKNKPLSSAEYEDLKQELLKRGLLEFRNIDNPNLGIIFTAPGVDLLDKILGITPP